MSLNKSCRIMGYSNLDRDLVDKTSLIFRIVNLFSQVDNKSISEVISYLNNNNLENFIISNFRDLNEFSNETLYNTIRDRLS